MFVLGLLSAPVWAAPAPRALPAATQKKLEALLRHPQLQSGRVGIAVVALGRAPSSAQFPAARYDGGAQPLLFARDALKRFTPASNFKLFTAAWVLHQLGPDKTFVTRVVKAPPVGVRPGAWPQSVPLPSIVTLYGDGDPSLTTADVQQLAQQLAAQSSDALIVRASDALFSGGKMGGEEGGGRYPDGWTLDDALWYYGAPISALAVDRNQVDVTLTGGAAPGEPATVKTQPPAPFSIFAPVITVEKGDPRAGKLLWTRGDLRAPLGDTLTIEGFLAPGQSDTEGVAVPDPRGWAQQIFEGELRQKSVLVVEPRGFYGQKDGTVAAQHVSPPLSVLLRRFLKNSDNLYGEMLLRRAAIELPAEGDGAATTASETASAPVAGNAATVASSGLAARAHRAMARWLAQNGVPTQGLRFSDGSGLSRYDVATPLAIARLLGAVEEVRGARAFYDALPVAGVDGTLKNRMKGSAAQGNVRAKTGTFSIVNCLSGYVTTRDGQRLAVSILTNQIEDGELARNWEGRVFATLADADFRAKP